MNSVITHIRRTALLPNGGPMPDGELLERFVARREGAAFEALVRRHGPMVLGVCRRVLHNIHDAEDAFQATFLVLVRKASSIGNRELLGNWLYGVAFRTALETRSINARRQAKERQVDPMPEPAALEPKIGNDYRSILDRELNRLPDKYRIPVVLCELEGQTRKEVAHQLRIPEGTLSSRLATARKMLAQRLGRNGTVLSSATLVGFLAQGSASASLSNALVRNTIQAATHFAAGKAGTAVVSAKVAAVLQGVMKTMFITKLKMTAVLILAIGLIGMGAGVLVPGALADKPTLAQVKAPPKAEGKKTQAPMTDKEKLIGTWKITAILFDGKPDPKSDEIVKTGFMYIFADAVYSKWGDKIDGPMTYQIDETQKPKTIDMTDDRRERTELGIYQLDGDVFKICFARGEEQRPKELASKEGSKTALITFHRDPKAEKLDLKKAEAARQVRIDRRASAKNLMKIGLAMHEYHDKIGHLPPPAIFDNNGKPLLSWRVALLPYLEQDDLFRQFKEDEPWDSANNKKLLEKMPSIYGMQGKDTFYQVFTGKDTAFEGKDGVKFQDVMAGLSQTILVAESGKSAPWTKPDDLPFEIGKPLPKLGGIFKDGFHLLMGDGSVRFVKTKFNEKTLGLLIQRNRTEVVDFDDLDK